MAKQLAAVADALKTITGQDFAHYKTGTVQRRVERRMALLAIDSWDDYVALLRRSREEADALAKDMLIHFTQFFRDPKAFRYLAEHVLPDLLSGHPPDQLVRIWYRVAAPARKPTRWACSCWSISPGCRAS